MISLAPREIDDLRKNKYGHIDAPRQWFSRARSELPTSVCADIFRTSAFSYRTTVRTSLMVLCCSTFKTSWVPVTPLVKKTRANVNSAFKYRTWLSEDHMERCGADVYRRGPPSMVEIDFETGTRQLKPVTLDKSRGASIRPLEANSLCMFRGLWGASSRARVGLQCVVVSKGHCKTHGFVSGCRHHRSSLSQVSC